MCASLLNKPSSQEGLKLVERLKDGGIFGSQTWAEVEALCREAATLISELQAALYLEKNRADNLEQNYQEATTRHPSFNEAIEAAAKVAEEPMCGIDINRFIANGSTLTDHKGNELFVAKDEVETILRMKADAIRSLKLPDYRGGEAKIAESEHSPSTLNAETE